MACMRHESSLLGRHRERSRVQACGGVRGHGSRRSGGAIRLRNTNLGKEQERNLTVQKNEAYRCKCTCARRASVGALLVQKAPRGRAEPPPYSGVALPRVSPASTGATHHFLRARPLDAASRSETPGANLGTRLAGILISEPVCGFRPVLALRCTEENVPKPTRVTFSPLRMASTTLLCMQFSALSACPLVMPASFAIAETSSALFINSSLFLGFREGTAPEPQ
jgi:hypothetical protein